MKEAVERELNQFYKEFDRTLQEELKIYFSSEGPGGKKIIEAFMEEFEALSSRSPQDDPTNIKNFMGPLREHITKTLDASIQVDSGGIRLGIGNDDFLGFTEDRSKLKHSPQPIAWLVYLIRGIAGAYAFVNNAMYKEKFGYNMPSQYAGGFLISKFDWEHEGWDAIFGPFEGFKHPASGAPPIPLFRNVIEKINVNGLMEDFLKTIIKEG